MEKTPKPRPPAARQDQAREAEARRKLARPPKDKKEVIIGPTDRRGPDVVIS